MSGYKPRRADNLTKGDVVGSLGAVTHKRTVRGHTTVRFASGRKLRWANHHLTSIEA